LKARSKFRCIPADAAKWLDEMTQAQFAKAAVVQPAQIKALQRSDPALKVWIKTIGPLEVPARQKFDLVDVLARSILYQQLHAKAAETIIQRLETLAGQKHFLPATLARLSEAEYRSVGVSANKAKALQSLAQAAIAGQVPSARQIPKLSNEALIDALVAIRGIGTWTVQMLLIFRLGRTDVWPIDDFGVRKGVQIAHEMAEMPSPKILLKMTEKHWSPHLTLAALYFWRIADLHKPGAVKP
jgi:DNA-3-methyladenine glycosylase II